jgi:hypothetical protein
LLGSCYPSFVVLDFQRTYLIDPALALHCCCRHSLCLPREHTPHLHLPALQDQHALVSDCSAAHPHPSKPPRYRRLVLFLFPMGWRNTFTPLPSMAEIFWLAEQLRSGEAIVSATIDALSKSFAKHGRWRKRSGRVAAGRKGGLGERFPTQ